LANEALSQKEIDELLAMLASGQEAEEEDVLEDDSDVVKAYNFKTANKFPTEQIRTLNLIYENYAGRLSIYLSSILRTICEVEVASIEEVSFGEFINSIPSPVLLCVVGMEPLQGSILFKVSSEAAFEIVGRLLGGEGHYVDINKAYTEIELKILDRVNRKMIQMMDEAWHKVIEVKARMQSMETSSQFVQIVEANEPAVIITLNVGIGGLESTINICIPHISVQPIKNQLAMKRWYSDNARLEDGSRKTFEMNETLVNTQLTLHAVFNKTDATVKEVVSLNEGDVIKIDHNVEQPLTIMIEHMPKLKAMMGKKGSKYAMKICEIIREDDD